MALESNFRYVADLNVNAPSASDPKSQGDDHLRGIKNVLVNQMGTLGSTILTATGTEINQLSGVTSPVQTQLNSLDSLKAPKASPTFTGNVTLPDTTIIGNVSAAEINALDGLTGNIQTQINSLDSLKAPKANPTFTGSVTVPTPSNTTDAATKGYADALAFSSALPGQGGQNGKLVTTDGTSASWTAIKTVGGESLLGSGDVATLPTQSAPDAGKFLKTNGTSASWADAKISNIVTATTSTTLTSTGTLLQIAVPTPGSPISIDAASYREKSIAQLNATRLLMVYSANVSPFGLTFSLVDTTNNYPTIISSISVALNTNGAVNTSAVRLERLSATTALCIYPDQSTGRPYATVVTISGTTISVGTGYEVNTSNAQCGLAALSATQAVAVYANGSNYLCSRLLSISGSVVTVNAEYVIDAIVGYSTNAGYNKVTTLSSTKALVVGCNGGTGLYGTVIEVSGTTFTKGTRATLASAPASQRIQIASTGGTSAVAVFKDSSNYASAVAVTISGTTITVGSPVLPTGSVASNNSNGLVMLSSARVVVMYYDNAVQRATTYNLSGTTLSGAVTTAIASGIMLYPDPVIASSSTQFIFPQGDAGSTNLVVKVYQDNGASGVADITPLTPSPYGVTVTLPDATTCTEGGPLHIVDNRGGYPIRIADSTGVLKAFVPAGVVSHISLNDNSTAAGTWAIENGAMVGIGAQLQSNLLTYDIVTVSLDSTREVLLGWNSNNAYLYAVVYNRVTNSFGAMTLVRAAAMSGSPHRAVKAGTDKVLVVSCNNGSTAFEAVVLSISGTTITVNTAATATLSSTSNGFADGCGLIAVGSSFVASYAVATPAWQIRALSVSGTTVTIGSAEVLGGTASGLIAASANHVIAVSTLTTNLYARPYLVSGSTLTAGTAGSWTPSSNPSIFKFFALGTRWAILYKESSGSQHGAILSLNTSGNGTITLTTVQLWPDGNLTDAIVIGTNKVLVIDDTTSTNANILTDVGGTALAGTAITLISGTSRACIYASGETAYVINNNGGSLWVSEVSCSVTSPVLVRRIPTLQTTTGMAMFGVSNSVLTRSAQGLYGSDFGIGLDNGTTRYTQGAVIKGVFKATFKDITCGTAYYRGVVDYERWLVEDTLTVVSKLEAAT
jgi:hypothetical protein